MEDYFISHRFNGISEELHIPEYASADDMLEEIKSIFKVDRLGAEDWDIYNVNDWHGHFPQILIDVVKTSHNGEMKLRAICEIMDLFDSLDSIDQHDLFNDWYEDCSYPAMQYDGAFREFKASYVGTYPNEEEFFEAHDDLVAMNVTYQFIRNSKGLNVFSN